MNVRSTHNAGPAGWLRKNTGSALVYFILLPIMFCLVLVLPPISLPSRLVSMSYVSVNKAGTTINNKDGAALTIPPDAVSSGSSIKLTTTTQDSFLASDLGHTLPSYLKPVSDLYHVDVQGDQPKETDLSIPFPSDAPSDSDPLETLDLYAYYNQQWFKIPFGIDTQNSVLNSTLNFTPQDVLVVQTEARAPVIGADPLGKSVLPDAAADILVEVNPLGLQIADQGSIAGEPVSTVDMAPSSNYAVLPTVSNVDSNGVRTDLTGNMMDDETARTAHINALVDLAVQKVYRGYNISYEGIATSDEPLYTAFIKELARALHAKQKILSITLPAPTPIAEDQFDTAGYDWALLGRYADEVKIPLLTDPRSFEGSPSLQDQYLSWVVGQIDRSKLEILSSTQGRNSTSDTYTPIGFGTALNLVGPVSVPKDAAPGSDVTITMDGLSKAGGIQVHEPSGLFYFNYRDAKDVPHTVWLENADSLAKKVDLALKYNLGGVILTDYDENAGMDDREWNVLENYKTQQPTTVENQLKLVWIVDGKSIGTSPVNDPKVIWKAPEGGTGQHKIEVALSVDGGLTAGPPLGSVVQLALQPTPTPTRPPTPTEEATAKPTPRPTSNAPRPTSAPKPSSGGGGPPPAQVGVNRFGYGIQLDWGEQDRNSELDQVNQLGFNWVRIQVRWCDISGSPGQADLGAVDDMANKAKAHNIQLLISVVCGPGWAGAGGGPPGDPNQLASFLGGIAGKYCHNGVGAIEVWNETNISREWGSRPLTGADYMNYLKPAYATIKQACADMIVVSGAETPTGATIAGCCVDTAQYLQETYAAGLKDYSDAIGIHPSGYNVPVTCDLNDPNCNDPSAAYQSPYTSRHYSFSFLNMMKKYREIMVANGDGNKQVWATEFGWGVSSHPQQGYEYETDNTDQEQADWLVGAYQWGKAQGWVGVMFTWNLDFPSGENTAFKIQGRPAFGALQAMPK